MLSRNPDPVGQNAKKRGSAPIQAGTNGANQETRNGEMKKTDRCTEQ